MPSKNMKGLTFFGHDDIKLNNTVDTEDQNKSIFNTTIYGLKFGKTCYDSIYFISSGLI